MGDWRADLERERHGVPSRPPPTDTGPTASYAAWVRQRECGDKRGYGHQLEARRAILRIAKAGGQDMREYRCEHCALWHLTRRVEEGERP